MLAVVQQHVVGAFSEPGARASYDILLAGELVWCAVNVHGAAGSEIRALHRREINKLMGAVEREGMTLVPLKLYFNPQGRAKIEIAVARGKKLHDKRETEKKRSWERERGRLMRDKG